MDSLKTYKEIADNDYAFVRKHIEDDETIYMMPALAQNTCEKYLKHLIEEYCVPQTAIEVLKKNDLLRKHSLRSIIAGMEEFGFLFDEDVKDAILKADGYYFTSRYPGSEWREATQSELIACAAGMDAAKKYVEDFIRTRDESSHDEPDDR